MELIKNLLPIVIAPLLGWLTNYIAVRMLFRPKKPPKVPFLNWLQGVIPSRKEVIAQKIGETVEKQLFTKEDINLIVKNMNIKEEIETTIGEIVDRELERMILPIPIKWNLAIKRKLLQTLERDIATVTENTIPSLLQRADIKEVVRNRISQFSNEELESIIISVADRELRHIVWLGGVIGLVIGIIQTIVNFVL